MHVCTPPELVQLMHGIHTQRSTVLIPVCRSMQLCKHRGGVWIERGRRARHVMSDASGRNNKGGEFKAGPDGEECVLTRDNGGPNG
jgi:hypothetical protein